MSLAPWHGPRALLSLRTVAARGALLTLSATCLARAAEPVARAGGDFEQPRGPAAMVTGLVIAGTSLGVGATLLATENTLEEKRAGLYAMHAGLALAPFAAHAVGGEWGRGALFSIAPALGGIGMVALLSERPEAPIKGKNKSQRIYPVLISISVVGSAIGIFDAAFVDQRRRSRPVALDAACSREFCGAFVRGVL